MCGIVGCASSGHPVQQDWLRVGRDALIHRGPDDSGEWWSADGRVGLAHRRLSILDLSPLGHQPMHLSQRGLSVVFNGEIYNYVELRRQLEQCGHSFRSHSDTEVILAAYAEWGTQCLTRLNGMFAIALYDHVNRRLLLARDRAGEKPLFYRVHNGAIYFASELKALLRNSDLPRRIDPAAMDCYLAVGYVPGARCILDGYQKLPPAHFLVFDLADGSLKVSRYWDLPEPDPAASQDISVLVDQLDSLLRDAVGRQLRADVPVGILLSGGVDSSIVTAIAADLLPHVRTFSVGFPGHSRQDETEHARLIARHFGTDHTELMAEPASAELIPLLSRQFDEPMADSSMIPTYLVSQLVRKHCTVALGGDGGDELFGGYHHHSRLLWMQERLGRIPANVRRSVAWGAEHVLPVGVKGRNFMRIVDVDMDVDLPNISAAFFDPRTRRRLMRTHGRWATPSDQIFRERAPHEGDLLQRATRMDFTNFLPDDILVKVDRASMLNSLELRAPLLDHHVIEFAFGQVPSYLKTNAGGSKKILLKRLTEKLLPAEFDRQRKQGFSIPISDWLQKGPFRDLFEDVLGRPDCTFDRKAVRSLLRGQDRGLANGDRLFALVQFECWRLAYRTYL